MQLRLCSNYSKDLRNDATYYSATQFQRATKLIIPWESTIKIHW